MQTMESTGNAREWIRGLSRALSDDPWDSPLSQESTREIRARQVSAPQGPAAKASAGLFAENLGVPVGRGEGPSGLSLAQLSYIDDSLRHLGDNGPDHLNRLQSAALFLTKKSAQIAKEAGLKEPRPSQRGGLNIEIELEAQRKWRETLARKPSPDKQTSPSLDLVQALEERLGVPLEKNLSVGEMRQLDAALKKLDAKGPEALLPKESKALFLTPASALVATKRGFEPPVQNESGELLAGHALSTAESDTLRRASQFNQTVGVDVAKGVSFGDAESYADRAAKVAAFQQSASEGLTSVGDRLKKIHKIESSLRDGVDDSMKRGLDAPSPFAFQK